MTNPPLGNIDPDRKRVVVHPVAKRRPYNPLRPRQTSRGSSTAADEAAAQAESDGRTSTAERRTLAEDQNLLRAVIKRERREFVTGSTASAVQAAHIIGALRRRRKVQSQHGFVNAKAAIEEWLSNIGFQYSGTFKLDGPGNLLLLCPHLRVHLDTYGTIAFTPPYDLLLRLSVQLAIDNKLWAESCLIDPTTNRKLTDAIYNPVDVNWGVLVLHRDDFLPEKQQLLVLKPEYRTDTLADSPDCWGLCHIATDPSFRLSMLFLGAQPLRLRPVSPLSLFAVIVNLHSKVQACSPEDLPDDDRPHLTFLKSFLDILVEQIWFRPDNWTLADNVVKIIAASVEKVNPSPAPAPAPPDRTPRVRDAQQSGNTSGDTMMVDTPEQSSPESSDEFSADITAWASAVPEGVVDTEDNSEDDDSEDEEHGTTTSEYLTLWQNLLGPSKNGRSKAQDGMHIFYGTRGFQRPYRPPAPDESEAGVESEAGIESEAGVEG